MTTWVEHHHILFTYFVIHFFTRLRYFRSFGGQAITNEAFHFLPKIPLFFPIAAFALLLVEWRCLCCGHHLDYVADLGKSENVHSL